MPRMSEAPAEFRTAKLLLIGDGKLGKTFYAGLAARKLNMLYLNGDVAPQTLSQLPMDVQANIYLMDVADSMLDGRKDARLNSLMTELTNNIRIRWNDDEQRVAKPKDAGNIWTLIPSMMDHNTVFVLDSWTALSESIMTAAAIAHGVDLLNATTSEMRPVYQSAGIKANQYLQVLRALKCHVIVIAHPDEFSHTTKPDGRKVKDIKETDLVVDWTKMIPKTTSKPQGLQMAKYFTDVAWMETNATGSTRFLNFKMSDDRVSGGHFNERKSADEYSFENLIKQIGGTIPAEPATIDSWLKIEHIEQAEAPAESKILDGTQVAPVKTNMFSGGLSGLAKNS